MRTKMTKQSIIHILRRVSQIATFILMPGFFVLVFAYIGSIYTTIISGSFNFVAMFPQIFLVAAVLVITALLGRFFCGYICAFGSMLDFLWFVRKKISKKQIKINEKTDRVLKLVKYFVLLFIVVFVWTFDIVSFSNTVSPWNIFGMYASYSGWPDENYLWSIGGLLLLVIILSSMFIERFFCRYLCPLGAIFALTSRFRFFRIKKPREKCNKCRLCTSRCEMGIPLNRYDIIKSGECINCFTCLETCPRKNISTNSKESIITAAAVVGITGVYYLGNIVDISGKEAAIAPLAENESIAEQGLYQDGVYSGSAPGYKGTTDVQVTVENGLIKEIEVVSTSDDAAWFDRVEEPIISTIIAWQTPDVDTITGATYSSYAIINAVADALILSDGGELTVIGDPDIPAEGEPKQGNKRQRGE